MHYPPKSDVHTIGCITSRAQRATETARSRDPAMSTSSLDQPSDPPMTDHPHSNLPQALQEGTVAQHRHPIGVHTAEGIGAAVARLRRAAGLTQSEFGDMVGASRPWVSNLERGNLRGGQLDTVLACIHALGYRVVLTDVDSGPSTLDDLKNAMRRGPLARPRADPLAAVADTDRHGPPPEHDSSR